MPSRLHLLRNPRLLVRAARARWRPPPPLPPAKQIAPADVTIIVLGWNGRDYTLACVESLHRAELGGARILVVDNGSTDGSVAALEARFPAVRILALPENIGYAGGNNAGIRTAVAEGAGAVLLLNNDTKVAPDFLAPLVDVLNVFPEAAAVSSAVMRLDSPQVLQEAYFEVYYGFGLIRRRGCNALPGEGFDKLAAVDAAMGCSLLVRGEALREVGLLDESYFAYHEEVDWCVRARERGYHIFYQPLSRVYHHFSRSTDAARPRRAQPRRRAQGPELSNPIPLQWNPVRTYLGARNSIRFMRAHGGVLDQLYFLRSTLYAIPLELLAAVLEREDELKLGLLTYRRALWDFCLEHAGLAPDAAAGKRPTPRETLRALMWAPHAILWALPRLIRQARAEGLTAQVDACIRGHLDGLANRPVPFDRLGLRPPRT
jgi:GT2 family glycosyltransferase